MSKPFSGSCDESTGPKLSACARRHEVLSWPCAIGVALAELLLPPTLVHRRAGLLTNGDEPRIGMLDQIAKRKFDVEAAVQVKKGPRHRRHRRDQPGGADVSARNDRPSNMYESTEVCFTAFEISHDEGQVALFAPQLHDELRASWRWWHRQVRKEADSAGDALAAFFLSRPASGHKSATANTLRHRDAILKSAALPSSPADPQGCPRLLQGRGEGQPTSRLALRRGRGRPRGRRRVAGASRRECRPRRQSPHAQPLLALGCGLGQRPTAGVDDAQQVRGQHRDVKIHDAAEATGSKPARTISAMPQITTSALCRVSAR
jgi:hypothetical protein